MQNNRASYVNHTLNNSPSKTTYSFSRSNRFPTYTHQYGRDQFGNVGNQNESNWGTRYGGREEESGFRRSKSKDRNSPYRGDFMNKNQKDRGNSRDKRESPSTGWRLKKSPKRRNQQYQSPEYEDQGQKRSPHKHKQIVKSYRNGYYPYGIQINKDGKYYVSNYSNVRTSSFGRPAGRNITNSNSQSFLYQSNHQNIGPGSYDISAKSPGRYVNSPNKNNDATKFSKSPRKFNQQGYTSTVKNQQNAVGPGMYSSFSQFGQLNK